MRWRTRIALRFVRIRRIATKDGWVLRFKRMHGKIYTHGYECPYCGTLQPKRAIDGDKAFELHEETCLMHDEKACRVCAMLKAHGEHKNMRRWRCHFIDRLLGALAYACTDSATFGRTWQHKNLYFAWWMMHRVLWLIHYDVSFKWYDNPREIAKFERWMAEEMKGVGEKTAHPEDVEHATV